MLQWEKSLESNSRFDATEASFHDTVVIDDDGFDDEFSTLPSSYDLDVGVAPCSQVQSQAKIG